MSYKINWTEDKAQRAIHILTDYFKKYGYGECIAQNDDAIIDSTHILSYIADDILIEGEGIIYNET